MRNHTTAARAISLLVRELPAHFALTAGELARLSEIALELDAGPFVRTDLICRLAHAYAIVEPSRSCPQSSVALEHAESADEREVRLYLEAVDEVVPW